VVRIGRDRDLDGLFDSEVNISYDGGYPRLSYFDDDGRGTTRFEPNNNGIKVVETGSTFKNILYQAQPWGIIAKDEIAGVEERYRFVGNQPLYSVRKMRNEKGIWVPEGLIMLYNTWEYFTYDNAKFKTAITDTYIERDVYKTKQVKNVCTRNNTRTGCELATPSAEWKWQRNDHGDVLNYMAWTMEGTDRVEGHHLAVDYDSDNLPTAIRSNIPLIGNFSVELVDSMLKKSTSTNGTDLYESALRAV